jgi:hypothetical protein
MAASNGQREEKYVSNILGKLHVVERTQAALYAWQEGLVKRGGGSHDSDQ